VIAGEVGLATFGGVVRHRWDERKERVNRAKHGVGFLEARSALQDSCRLSRADLEHSQIKERVQVVGYGSRGRLLAVVIAQEPPGIIRIISARRATKRKRHAYETGSF
jgi:uncharacterized protein